MRDILIYISMLLLVSNAYSSSIIGGPINAGNTVRPVVLAPYKTLQFSRGYTNPNGETTASGVGISENLAGKYVRFKRDTSGLTDDHDTWAHIKPIKFISKYNHTDPQMSMYYVSWIVEGGEAWNELVSLGVIKTKAAGTTNSSRLKMYIYSTDSDNDADGYDNDQDVFPDDAEEWFDTDSDGLGDNSDPDIDGDGILNATDPDPLVPDSEADSDGDSIPNYRDEDDDNDTYPDTEDAFPYDPEEWLDTDGDLVGNNSDSDDDGDGTPDVDDDMPLDPNSTSDTDGDGVPDEKEIFGPYTVQQTFYENRNTVAYNRRTNGAWSRQTDPNEIKFMHVIVGPYDTDDEILTYKHTGFRYPLSESWAVYKTREDLRVVFSGDSSTKSRTLTFVNEVDDWDGDGVPNELDAAPFDVSEHADSDEDGILDSADAFPNDPNEWLDSDLDGIGDNADVFPNDDSESTDTDEDNIGDNADAFPLDPNEWLDSDFDGIGDNADNAPLNHNPDQLDDDEDGFGNIIDAFPNDPDEWLDSDEDGTGDNTDEFPNDPDEWQDSDDDGIGDNADAFPNDRGEWLDSDKDGTGDNTDEFPNDPNEWLDSDDDGTGNNADVFPNNPSETIDSDDDGTGDNADLDDDNDGLSDVLENVTGGDLFVSDIRTTLNYIKSYGLTLYTESEYNSVIAQRDARPTQESYDAMVAERDARPTQESYDAMVVERDDFAEQYNTLDSRVFAVLPKTEQITTNYTLTLLDSGSLGSNQDYTTVSDQGFDFNALQGKLRWYSNGVEILDNSAIRITKNDNEKFDFESIVFAEWDSQEHFTTIYAETESEAKVLAQAEYNSRLSYFKIIDDSGMEIYTYTKPSNTASDDFSADLIGGGDKTLLDSGSLGSNQDYTTVSDQGFDFNALQGKLRWYSNGVEILDNSVIRITKNDNEKFDFESIVFAEWEFQNNHFHTIVNAETESEAKSQAQAEYNSRLSYFKIIDDSGIEIYTYTKSSTSLDEFLAHQLGGSEWMVDYMGPGGDGDPFTTISTPAYDVQYVDIISEGYKVHVDGFNVSTEAEWMVDYVGPGGEGDAFSTISTPLANDIQYVDVISEGYNVHVDGFNISYTETEPQVATKTLEEHVSDLENRADMMESERDARPTQADYDSVVAERDAKLTMEEVRDMKLKSQMMQVDEGNASLNIVLEATDNLGITNPTWSRIPEDKVVIHPNFQNGKIRIDVEGDDDSNTGTRFYRFTMGD